VGKSKKIKELMLDFLYIVAGSVVFAISIDSFSAPNNIAAGGLTGIATLLNYLFNTPIGMVVLILNIPISIWAIVDIGYKFVIKTGLAIVISSVLIDVFALFLPVYRGDMIITSLIAGVLQGVGLALVLVRGVTTGGTDMIARLLSNRFRHLSTGKFLLAVDGIIVLAAMLVFKNLESAVYAGIVIFVSTVIIDAILYGTDVGTGKMLFIISPKVEEVADVVFKELDRGVTFLKSRGGYTKIDGEILFCAVRRFEVHALTKIVRRVDPNAFVIVGDAGEISGEGFKSHRSDDKTLKEIMSKFSKAKKRNKLL